MSAGKPAAEVRQTTLRSPLGRARGLGSAKDGTHHWRLQRITALANTLLVLWFVLSLLSLSGASHAEATAWIATPLNAVLLIALILSVFSHAQAGLQVVMEDYIHTETLRVVAILAMKGLVLLVGLASLFAVLRIAL